jgi:hypothetical protein
LLLVLKKLPNIRIVFYVHIQSYLKTKQKPFLKL